MSVVGFDEGNQRNIIAVACQRGIDVVLNDEPKWETPTVVCFGEKQCFIVTAGVALSMMNPKNSISHGDADREQERNERNKVSWPIAESKCRDNYSSVSNQVSTKKISSPIYKQPQSIKRETFPISIKGIRNSQFGFQLASSMGIYSRISDRLAAYAGC